MRFFKLLVVGFAFFFMACASTRTTTDLPETLKAFNNPNSNIVMVASHRGAHMDNFENSIASAKQAIRLGVDIIEADVKTTKDGYLVLMHDSSIDRTTTGKGKVEDLTLAEIRKYKLKAPYGRISKETVPTFEEFLKVTKGKIMVDVDMKTDNVEGILAAVEKTGTHNEVFYFDNDYDQLDRIKTLRRSAQLMPRAYSLKMADSAIVKFAPPVIHIDKKFNSKEVGDLIKRNNSRIWMNTLGEFDAQIRYGHGEEALREVLKHGVNIIQTDEPEMLLQLLRHKGLHE
ncbi:glycerophosphodiester phosphodiesterase family protein [Maribacter polysiphoniae]|uniref:Glycerophosphodiester phosphodiesterase family protein n=1 Tax=Maribacter polysiphoniae TaxID=429344 RepID=A0A316E192_9FLAO|nr:glycerophosphodiester phosphodiesterase family protein [Maribacter polysiphoniae]MBD1261023.1 glycerophosphodiester phosphodiesterase family protein [Maribacter polysiphoniae]PWK23736.1 glycerophosphoryl diester phosphodiesterase [Maribacter polysiphoniae]